MSANITFTEFFPTLRERGAQYVDKTGFFEEFFYRSKDGLYWPSTDVALFTRPRRFGKTLFMTMLASFFDITKDSRSLFAGLKVAGNAKLCEQWMNQYPVIYLTFKDIAGLNFADAKDEIINRISDVFCLHNYILLSDNIIKKDKEIFSNIINRTAQESDFRDSLLIITRVLFHYYRKKPIILIDEYDVPVAKSYSNKYYSDMINLERNILAKCLKSNPYLNFAILTGCLRITKESIFTGLNNIICCDIATNRYSDTFGFTQSEVDKLLVDANCTEKRDVIRDWYDGYHFGKRQDIYCPWSILYYLEDVRMQGPQTEPKAYWVNTSANELPKDVIIQLQNATKARGAIASLLAGIPIRVTLNPEMNYVDIFKGPNNFWTLLYLTGYLTRVADPEEYVDGNLDDDANAGLDEDTAFLSIPNREVRKVFEKEFKAWLADILAGNTNKLRKDLYDALWKGDVTEIEKAVSAVLVGCNVLDHKESYYHGVLYTLLWLENQKTTSNGPAGMGYYDIIVPIQKEMCAAVLEVKRIASKTPPDKLEEKMEKGVEEALNQIKDTRYDERLRKDGYTRILHVGIAFHGQLVKAGVKEA